MKRGALPAALTAILLLAGCRSDPRPDIVLVTIDTLRADHLSAYGYRRLTSPNIDALAARGVLFENAFSPVPETLPACAALLSGDWPARMGVRGNGRPVPEDLETLATHLSQAGYATAAFVSGFPLVRRLSGLHRGFEVYDDTLPDARGPVPGVQRGAEKTTNAALAWLQKRDSRPYFLWLHYYDPHGDYVPPPEYARLFPPEGTGPRVPGRLIPAYQRLGDSEDGALYTARYDAEIRRVDTELQRVVQRLDLGRTLLVVTADHGESLTEHGYYFDHGNELYAPSIHVPLILAGVGVPDARRIDAPVRLVDVHPTILEILGRTPAAGISGRSLLPEMQGDDGAPPEEALSEARFAPYRALTPGSDVGPKVAVRDSRFTVILRLNGVQVEAYDRLSDPGETDDLLRHDASDLAARLARALQSRLAAVAGGAPDRPALGADLRRGLERLSAGRAPAPPGEAP